MRFDTLTPREREIMALVASGLMNKQVAGKIGLSEITVKVHRGRVMKKMGAKVAGGSGADGRGPGRVLRGRSISILKHTRCARKR